MTIPVPLKKSVMIHDLRFMIQGAEHRAYSFSFTKFILGYDRLG